MALIDLHDIVVDFPLPDGRILHASRHVNLQIREGEIVAIVGESGCGKSTMGKVALGTLKPDGGTVSWQGEDIWAPAFRMTPEKRALVQVVHQDPFASLNPVRTIGQTLDAPLRLARSRGLLPPGATPRSEAHRLLELVGLTPPDYYLSKYPHQLSGGQKQRVSIARATIMRPRCILADEPVSAVDASMRLAILDLMRKLRAEENISFLYVTHDLATARYLAREGRIVVMYLGQIIEEGPILTVLDAPRHPYLQALLAAIPVPDPRRAKEMKPLPLTSFDVPSPIDLPPGCVFRPRCPHAFERCRSEVPRLHPVSEDGHHAACHLVAPDRGRDQDPTEAKFSNEEPRS